MPEIGLRSLGQGSRMRAWSGEGQAGLRQGVPKTETKVVGGRDTWWKVLEGAWVVRTHGSEFRCCRECNRMSNGINLLLFLFFFIWWYLCHLYTCCNW